MFGLNSAAENGYWSTLAAQGTLRIFPLLTPMTAVISVQITVNVPVKTVVSFGV